MLVEWDEGKCWANLEKHGLSFEDAWQILAGNIINIPDAPYDYGEDPLITMGRIEGRVVVVVHVVRGENTRIISMRKANAREQEIYQKRLGQD